MDEVRQDLPAKPTRKRRHFLSYKRRWAIWGSLLLMIALLIAYNTLTQDHRIRAFLERELSAVVRGPVTVKHASFTLARGLEVRDVTLSAGSEPGDDTQLFHAQQLNISLDYSKLLKLKFDRELLGRVEAEHVQIHLTEDPATNSWNFQRLLRSEPREPQPEKPLPAVGGPTGMPAVFLHDALVRFSRRVDGKLQPVGDVNVNATIFPMSERSYGFNIVTNPSSGKDVQIIGGFDGEIGELSGRVTEVDIDHALRDMLPSRVRDWFREYDFTGRFSLPLIRYRFNSTREPASFEAQLHYEEARCTIQPRHWLTRDELWRMALVRETIHALDMLGMDQPIPHDKILADSDADVVPTDLISYLKVETRPIPLYLTGVTGQTTFTEHTVKVDSECRLQGQQLLVSAEMQGYSASAAGVLSIGTKPGTFIQIPPSQQFMAWVPDDVRKAYLQFKPRGKGVLNVQLTRELPGGPFDPVVDVGLFDSQLEFDDFPYPLQNCTGRFIFSHDSQSNLDLLRIQDLKGYGVAGGPNANSLVEINGIIGPFPKGGPGIDVRVKGLNITSEPALRKSFPRDVAKAMQLFGPPDFGHRLAASNARDLPLSPEEAMAWPQFFGDFDVHVVRSGDSTLRKRPVNVDVELRLKKATGTLKLFPYPMHDLTAVVNIRNEFLEIHNLQMQRNGATLKLDGKVSFDNPINPDIQVDARNVPLDDDLLDALPPTERDWVNGAGLAGRVDINGRVFLADSSTSGDSDVDFDLNLRAHDATLLKDANGPAITDLNGDLFLEPSRLKFTNLSGRRGSGSLTTSGSIDWQDKTPDFELKLNARDLLLDKALHDILPASVQENWDQHRPEGTTDLDLDYISYTPPPGEAAGPTTRPTDKVQLALRPRQLSAFTDVFPYRLDNLGGEITVDDNHVRLINLTGRHGDTVLRINADGTTGPAMDFKLDVLATDVKPDNDLKSALPESLVDVMDGIAADGLFTIRFDKLHVRNSPLPLKRSAVTPTTTKPRASTSPSRAPSTQPVDVDFDCVITSTGSGKIDIGLPVSEIHGWTQLAGEVREGSLTKLNGLISADSYSMNDRRGANLTATLRKPDFADGLLLQSIRTDLAGGSMAGEVTILSHDDAPSQYAVYAIVQNADLAQVLGQTKNPMKGSVSGNCDVEGIFGDTRNRRGRGRIQISGNDMDQAPIILGFFRLVNFALPLRDGVNNVEVSYTLMGEQATFDSIELSAPGLRIYGDGVLDFARSEWNLTLNTENPDAWGPPLLDKIARRVREELLQLRIKGTLEQPKVQAMPFPTFQATVDKVVQDVKEGRR